MRLWLRGSAVVILSTGLVAAVTAADPAAPGKSSYMEVKIEDSFADTVKRREREQAERGKRHKALLEARYDLTDRKQSDARP